MNAVELTRGHRGRLSLAVSLDSPNREQMVEIFGYQEKKNLFYSVDNEESEYIFKQGRTMFKATV